MFHLKNGLSQSLDVAVKSKLRSHIIFKGSECFDIPTLFQNIIILMKH